MTNMLIHVTPCVSFFSRSAKAVWTSDFHGWIFQSRGCSWNCNGQTGTISNSKVLYRRRLKQLDELNQGSQANIADIAVRQGFNMEENLDVEVVKTFLHEPNTLVSFVNRPCRPHFFVFRCQSPYILRET